MLEQKHHRQHLSLWETVLLVMVIISSKAIPHPPNLTIAISLVLLTGICCTRTVAIFVTLISMVVSDLLLAYLNGYAAFGMWSLFTYSGFLGATLLGNYFPSYSGRLHLLLYAMASVIGFWLWTNFGVWLTAALYPLTVHGLITCYLAAIPFLANDLLANSLFWLISFVLLLGTSHVIHPHQIRRTTL